MFSVWKFMNRGIQSPERLIYPRSFRERECRVYNGHNQWVSINGYQWVISFNFLLPTTKDTVQAVSTLRHPWPKIFTEGWLVDVFGEGSSRTDAVAVLTPFALLDPSGMQYNWEHCDTWTDTIFMNLHRACSGSETPYKAFESIWILQIHLQTAFPRIYIDSYGFT